MASCSSCGVTVRQRNHGFHPTGTERHSCNSCSRIARLHPAPTAYDADVHRQAVAVRLYLYADGLGFCHTDLSPVAASIGG